ncbi:MAG: Outer rane receptor for ferrienterochelin and colicin [Acidobacteria bacterium]|nr:Outer rane receptor for ferrienterochelin and colicin [Acidobacteriota bacterium]
MNRLITLVGTAVVAGAVWASPAEAQPGAALGAEDRAPRVASAAPSGLIEGAVVNEQGWPLPGVTVSALGATTALAVTDRAGAFRLQALPAGGYLVRAHLAGFAPSRREFVQVGPGRPARFSVTLRRSADAPAGPPLLAASLGPTGDGPGEAEAAETDASEKTWRLRHLQRSILKETEERVALADDQPPDDHSATTVTRALRSSSDFLAGLPLTAEVNFLTSGSFDGSDASSTSDVSTQRTAYVSLGGPAFHGDWSGQVMTQGNLGSWFVAGTYRKRAPASHLFDVNVSYSAVRFSAARWTLSPQAEGARSAGTVSASDTWAISPRVTFAYGGRYARYDYLESGLFSPNVRLVVEPVEGLRLVGSASRRMLAPGAEQFLAPLNAGAWLPPEQGLVGESLVAPEATNSYELGFDQALWPEVVIAVRAFVQETRHQQAVLFGDFGIGPEPAGRYAVADSGNVDARGWSIGISGSPWGGAHGSVLYSMTEASWFPGLAGGEGLLLVGLTPRAGRERLQDLTTSFEAEIAPTATTVVLAYRLNSGFARVQGDAVEPGFDSRFDLQVVQRLPFLDFTSARWQALVALRNTFRDPQPDSSVYDELLVLRPPKRVVGGLLVRF